MQGSNTVMSSENLAKALVGGKRAEAQFVACSEGVGMTGPVLKIKNKNHFSVVPDNLLENKTLSLQARAVAGWLVGRSDNFEIRISSLKRILGITDFVWVKIRKELEKNGYWKSSRTFDQKTGNIVWEHIFSVDSTIPNFTMNGGTIDGIAMDGGTINGKPGDISTLPIREYQYEITKKNLPEREILPPTPPGGSGGLHVRSFKNSGKSKPLTATRSTEENPVKIPEWLDPKDWNDYVEHRREISSPMSPSAQKKILAELERLRTEGNDPVRVIDQSIINRWKGLFPIKGSNGSKASPVPSSTKGKNQYQMDLDWWKKIPYELKRKYLNRGGFGMNSDYPDSQWLRKIVLEYWVQNGGIE